MEGDWEGEVVHEGWLTKSPPLETKTRQIFSQTLIQPVSVSDDDECECSVST